MPFLGMRRRAVLILSDASSNQRLRCKAQNLVYFLGNMFERSILHDFVDIVGGS